MFVTADTDSCLDGSIESQDEQVTSGSDGIILNEPLSGSVFSEPGEVCFWFDARVSDEDASLADLWVDGELADSFTDVYDYDMAISEGDSETFAVDGTEHTIEVVEIDGDETELMLDGQNLGTYTDDDRISFVEEDIDAGKVDDGNGEDFGLDVGGVLSSQVVFYGYANRYLIHEFEETGEYDVELELYDTDTFSNEETLTIDEVSNNLDAPADGATFSRNTSSADPAFGVEYDRSVGATDAEDVEHRLFMETPSGATDELFTWQDLDAGETYSNSGNVDLSDEYGEYEIIQQVRSQDSGDIISEETSVIEVEHEDEIEFSGLSPSDETLPLVDDTREVSFFWYIYSAVDTEMTVTGDFDGSTVEHEGLDSFEPQNTSYSDEIEGVEEGNYTWSVESVYNHTEELHRDDPVNVTFTEESSSSDFEVTEDDVIDFEMVTPEDGDSFNYSRGEEGAEVWFRERFLSNVDGYIQIMLDDEVLFNETHEPSEDREVYDFEDNLSSGNYTWNSRFVESDSGEVHEAEEEWSFEVVQEDELVADINLESPEEGEEFGPEDSVSYDTDIDVEEEGTVSLIHEDEVLESWSHSGGFEQYTYTQEDGIESGNNSWSLEFEADSDGATVSESSYFSVESYSDAAELELLSPDHGEVFSDYGLAVYDFSVDAPPGEVELVETVIEEAGTLVDGFESGSIDSDPEWDIVDDNGTVEVQSSEVWNGDYALRLYGETGDDETDDEPRDAIISKTSDHGLDLTEGAVSYWANRQGFQTSDDNGRSRVHLTTNPDDVMDTSNGVTLTRRYDGGEVLEVEGFDSEDSTIDSETLDLGSSNDWFNIEVEQNSDEELEARVYDEDGLIDSGVVEYSGVEVYDNIVLHSHGTRGDISGGSVAESYYDDVTYSVAADEEYESTVLDSWSHESGESEYSVDSEAGEADVFEWFARYIPDDDSGDVESEVRSYSVDFEELETELTDLSDIEDGTFTGDPASVDYVFNVSGNTGQLNVFRNGSNIDSRSHREGVEEYTFTDSVEPGVYEYYLEFIRESDGETVETDSKMFTVEEPSSPGGPGAPPSDDEVVATFSRDIVGASPGRVSDHAFTVTNEVDEDVFVDVSRSSTATDSECQYFEVVEHNLDNETLSEDPFGSSGRYFVPDERFGQAGTARVSFQVDMPDRNWFEEEDRDTIECEFSAESDSGEVGELVLEAEPSEGLLPDFSRISRVLGFDGGDAEFGFCNDPMAELDSDRSCDDYTVVSFHPVVGGGLAALLVLGIGVGLYSSRNGQQVF